jgi:T5SS/PEP-CTERM-associated repeat protein
VWNTGRELSVGYSGNGTLNVEAGGNVTNPIYGYVGNNPGSTGTVIVKGANSQLSNFNLYVGNSGSGTLNVEDRGNVTNQNGYVGTNLGSSGTVIVTGAHSRWINNANLYVGDTGNGTLNVQGGGIVSNQNGYIGANSGSTGTVMVTDTNSNWNNTGSLYIGGSGSAAGGTGSLSISNSGKVTIAGTTKIWNEGTLTINGGILDTQHFDASIGTFNFVSGVLQVSGTTTVPDALVLRNGSTLFNNGTIAAPVVVGSGGFVKGTGNFGSLTVNSGGIVSPGLSPGKLTDMSTAWNSGGTYLWEINRLATNGGVAGLGLGWDLWNTGALTIGGEFTINLASVTAGSTAGALPGWSTTAPLSWQIATANNGAFTSIAKLTVNSQIFQQFNSLNGGGFSLASANSGNSLLLYFTPAVVVEGGNLSAPNTSLQGNSLSAGSGNTLAIDPNAQVSGFGAISPPGNTQTITNSGTISANVPRQTLSISSQTFVNQGGTVQATGGGILNIDAETYTQTSGTTNLGTNGTVTSSTFEIQGGTLSGSGTINTTLVNNGTVAPGNSPGMLTIDGSYTQEASGILEIELAGLLAGEYDQLIVTGDANLAGTLSVNLIDGFELGPNQWFDILVVGETQAGTFAGLADHALVGKFGGYDLFITYATSTSGAGASLYTIPEPGSLALAATGLLGLLALGRRHRFVTGREW